MSPRYRERRERFDLSPDPVWAKIRPADVVIPTPVGPSILGWIDGVKHLVVRLESPLTIRAILEWWDGKRWDNVVGDAAVREKLGDPAFRARFGLDRV